mmetsp:Transcript_18772/g.48710  ORF Transcript_18772/g.48710 Transcript_18772/m.48710 type:complete len:229 (+) Transcript_18772:638-1324(+)
MARRSSQLPLSSTSTRLCSPAADSRRRTVPEFHWKRCGRAHWLPCSRPVCSRRPMVPAPSCQRPCPNWPCSRKACSRRPTAPAAPRPPAGSNLTWPCSAVAGSPKSRARRPSPQPGSRSRCSPWTPMAWTQRCWASPRARSCPDYSRRRWPWFPGACSPRPSHPAGRPRTCHRQQHPQRFSWAETRRSTWTPVQSPPKNQMPNQPRSSLVRTRRCSETVTGRPQLWCC